MAKLNNISPAEKEKRQKEILDMIAGDVKLRSKRELIEKFIIENLPQIGEDDIEQGFEDFMNFEKQKAFQKFVEDENINSDKLRTLVEDYLFSQRTPTRHEVIDTLDNQPSVLQRKSNGETLLLKFNNFIDTFFGN